MKPPSFYVISHERSGTHFAINTLLKNTVGIEGQANVGEWFGPYDDANSRFDHIDQAFQSIPPNGTLIKSHCDADLYRARYPSRPVLWVVRDPRDTLVSWFHYLNNEDYYANNPQVERFQNGSFDDFLRRPLTDFLRYSYSLTGNFDQVADRWCAHTQSWARSGLNVCVLRYEELLSNFEATLRRAADFLGLALRPVLEPVGFGEGLSHLPRKGIIGDRKNEASPETLRWLDEKLRRHGLEEFCYPPPGQILVWQAPPRSMPPTPRRLLFLRPDAYGDLVLFEPVLRVLREAWPETEIAVLIRHQYSDITSLLDPQGVVRWLTTSCDPYRESPGESGPALEALRTAVLSFAPDCLVAACASQTWLESAVAAFLPGIRQVSVGPGWTDPISRAALTAELSIDWSTIYPEKIPVETDEHEWERNLRLAGALAGDDAPRWWPLATVPEHARKVADRIVAESGLAPGEFVACAAAGTANVPIKHWPAAHYGETLAWLERERGIRALLIGHVAEREHLEAVRQIARAHGAEPALWLGQDGEMPVVAGLLAAARFYFGNDTSALHLAAALGQPVLPIFGGGTWPRFQPVARRSLIVVQPLPCFGCAWDCYFVDAPCVRTISPASVQRALEQFLRDEAGSETIFEAEGLGAGARALIDTATPRLRFVREDSTDRLQQIQRLTLQTESLSGRLQTKEADHLQQVEELGTLLEKNETDRNTRLHQVEELSALVKESEADRAARLHQVEELSALVKESEADRAARLHQVEELSALVKESEADRAARLHQVEELTELLKESEADRAARLDHIVELRAVLQENERHRADLGRQIEEMRALQRAKGGDPAMPADLSILTGATHQS